MLRIVLWMLFTSQLYKPPNFGVKSATTEGVNLTRNNLTSIKVNYDVDSGSFITPIKRKYEDSYIKRTENNFDRSTRRKKRQTFTASETYPRKHPYAVVLVRCRLDRFCDETSSGTLISLQWVLTSWRLIHNSPEGHLIKIIAGAKKSIPTNVTLDLGSQMRISSIFFYSKENWIGLVKAETPFYETGLIKPISIALEAMLFEAEEAEESTKTCSFTGFNKFEPSDSESYFTRETITTKVGLSCGCDKPTTWNYHQLPNGKLELNESICSNYDTYTSVGSCPVPIGASLVCDGQVRGVLDRVVQVRVDDDYICYFNGDLKENCKVHDRFDEESKYTGFSTYLFIETYNFLKWINESTRILPPRPTPQESSTDLGTDDGTYEGDRYRGASSTCHCFQLMIVLIITFFTIYLLQ